MKYFVIALTLFSSVVVADRARLEEAFQYLKTDENAKAAKIYEELAANGDVHARYTIALFYEHGTHYNKDTQKAIVIYESLCENYVEPCNKLGEAYASLSRYDLAEKAYLKAAGSGDLRAYGNLSILYYNKKWAKHDFTKAKYWNQKLNSADWNAYNQRKNLTKHVLSDEQEN